MFLEMFIQTDSTELLISLRKIVMIMLNSLGDSHIDTYCMLNIVGPLDDHLNELLHCLLVRGRGRSLICYL